MSLSDQNRATFERVFADDLPYTDRDGMIISETSLNRLMEAVRDEERERQERMRLEEKAERAAARAEGRPSPEGGELAELFAAVKSTLEFYDRLYGDAPGEAVILDRLEGALTAAERAEGATAGEVEEDRRQADEAQALEPFLRLAREVINPANGERPWHADSQDWMVVFSFAGQSLTLGDLRRAAALSTPSREPDVQRNRGKTNTSDEHVNDPDMLDAPSPEAGREEDLRAEVLAIFKANKMATDERLAILIAERLAPRLSPPAPEPEDLEDEISDALQDSLGPDWTCRDGAKAVMRLLEARHA